jgi:hypothetical protein
MLPYNQKDIRHITAYAIKESIDLVNRKINFVISTNEVDRDNEIVEVSAITAAIPGFAIYSPFIASHKHRTENAEPTVIGSWLTETYKAFKDHSEMYALFGPTKLAEQYWLNYSQYIQRAVSIGFIPLGGSEVGFVPTEGHEEITPAGKRIYHHTKIELLEISAVAIGSNRRSLSKEFSEELDAEFDALSKEVSQLKTQIQELKTILDDHFDEIKSLLIHDSDGFAKELLLNNSDDPSSAVNKKKSEQKVIRVLEKAINNLNKD